MSNLLTKYQKEIGKQLKSEFNIKNDLDLPFLEKIVLNVGVSEALNDKSTLEKVKEQLAAISGQFPMVTRAKKSISSFKLRAGDNIGVMVTLRGKRGWDFLEKFISIVVPRMRDFRGMPSDNFDQKGNYSIGIPEQIIFPDIDYSKIDKPRGLVVTLVIKNSDGEKSKKMLELLGLPFKKAN